VQIAPEAIDARPGRNAVSMKNANAALPAESEDVAVGADCGENANSQYPPESVPLSTDEQVGGAQATQRRRIEALVLLHLLFEFVYRVKADEPGALSPNDTGCIQEVVL
jgi:hypothetical protein